MIGVQYIPASWKSTISVNGNRKYLGTFKNEEDANQARAEAEELYKHEINYIKNRDADMLAEDRRGVSSKEIAYDFGVHYEYVRKIIRSAR